MEAIAPISQTMLVASSLSCATVLNHSIIFLFNLKVGDHEKWMHGGSINSQKGESLDQKETQENVHVNLIDNNVGGIVDGIRLSIQENVILHTQND